MKAQIIYRWSGMALLMGGVLCTVSSTLGAVLLPGDQPTPAQILSAPWMLFEVLLFIGLLLVTAGLPGGYLRQSARAGRSGFIGFLALWLGILLTLGFAGARLVLWPYFAQSAPNLLPSGDQGPTAGFLLWILLPSLLLIVGPILLGLAARRAAVFPGTVGILLITAGVLNILTFLLPPSRLGDLLDPLSDAALFIALAWMGYLLAARVKELPAPQAASAYPASRAE